MAQRRAGIIFLKIDGEQFDAKGNFTYGMGKPNRESIMGSDGFHGYKEMPQAAFIEGEITDSKDLDVDKLANITDSTITLELANSKVVVLRNAFSTNKDGLSGQTEEGNIPVRFEGASAEEVR